MGSVAAVVAKSAVVVITLILYYKGSSIPTISIYRSDSLPDFCAVAEYIAGYVCLKHVNVVEERRVYACSNKQHQRMNNHGNTKQRKRNYCNKSRCNSC